MNIILIQTLGISEQITTKKMSKLNSNILIVFLSLINKVYLIINFQKYKN